LELCLKNNIKVTEELADKLGGSLEENEIDNERLLHVAEACLQQRSYHLACKKFSQGGDKNRAMKALLKSGDTERIIFFASMSLFPTHNAHKITEVFFIDVSGPKQKEIYIVAANFLQTLDWRNNPTIMKAIISFYTKSRSFESLASFYEACSHVEIDEYQSYDKVHFGNVETKTSLGCSPNSLVCTVLFQNITTGPWCPT
jgi:intraflagellar transport protein 140